MRIQNTSNDEFFFLLKQHCEGGTMSIQQLSFFDDQPYESTFEKICSRLGIVSGPGWPDFFGQAILNWFKSTNQRPIRTLSLFSGAGGLDIGFHDAGFDIVSSVEIDERFVATLKANSGQGKYFENSQINCIDIRDYKPRDLGEIDFIIGGPPCQPFSAAGRRAAGVLGTTDERGQLFQEYVRILKELSPKGFLFENVYGITGAENGKAWEEIKQAFADAGYNIFFRVLDAADYGVPQFRERMIIVGTKNREYYFPRPTHGPDSFGNQPYYTAGEAVANCTLTEEDLNRKVNGRYGHLLEEIPPGLNYSFFTEKMGHPKPIFAWRSKFSDFLYKADPDMPVRTIKAQGGQYTGPFHWQNRPFSISELKRLQTFPDNYSIVGGRNVAIQQIGNSVPPQLARILALSILEQIFDIRLPFDLPYLGHNETLGFRKRKRELTKIYAEKAKKYIQAINTVEIQDFSNRKYTADLAVNFDWKETETGNYYVSVYVEDNELQISVSKTRNTLDYEFEIIVEAAPTKPSWVLNVERVRLRGEKLDMDLFTSVWKAFEKELIRTGIKADLVQLCGYYQYEPSIQSQLVFLNENKNITDEWKVLQAVVSGLGVRKVMHTSEFAEIWNIPDDQVHSFAVFLRKLGYEVRNHKTNPQIEEGYYLIPYSFPTLNPLSVQLNKSLE